MLGNDIVDIRCCEPPHYQHVRHLDRVCTLQEAAAVRSSLDPVRALASVWAAKEAAFKLFSRQLDLFYFVPKQFVLQIENRDPALMDQKLSVLHAGLKTGVFFCNADSWVHAVAAAPALEVHWKVLEIDKCSHGGRRANSESEAVRSLANVLMEELGLEDVSLQFDGRVPKLKRKGRQNSGIYVSLTHHGAFAAVAIGWPAYLPPSPVLDETSLAEINTSEAVCSTCIA